MMWVQMLQLLTQSAFLVSAIYRLRDVLYTFLHSDCDGDELDKHKLRASQFFETV